MSSLGGIRVLYPSFRSEDGVYSKLLLYVGLCHESAGVRIVLTPLLTFKLFIFHTVTPWESDFDLVIL